MANNADVQLTVKATTLGAESIRSMADDVRALAKSGGDAAPQFQALAQQLDAVANQAEAVDTLQALERTVEATSVAAVQAATSLEGAKVAFNDAKAAADAQRVAQDAANASLQQAKLTAIDTQQALRTLRAEVQSHSEVTTQDTQSMLVARQAYADATAEVARQKIALQELNGNVSDAVAIEKSRATAVAASQRTLDALNTSLGKQQSVAAEAADAATKLGVATADLAAEQTRLLDTQNELAQTAVRTQQALEAEALAAANLAFETAELQRIAAEVQAELLQEAKARDAVTAAAKAQSEELARQDALYEQYLAEVADLDAALAAQKAATEALTAAQNEQAESDRLALIVMQGMADLRKEGIQDLANEKAAFADAETSIASYNEMLAAAKQRLVDFATASEAAAERVSAAFSDTGVRSLQEIGTEIGEVQRAMVLLQQEFEAGAITEQDFTRATAGAAVQLQALNREAAQIPQTTTFINDLSHAANGLVNEFYGLAAVAGGIGLLVKPALDATNQLDALQRILTQVYGSLEAANEQIANLDAVATKAHVPITEVSVAFEQFAVSAKTAGVSTEQIKEVFNATISAAGNLGLSGEKVTGILEALGQMASKGVVSMEELRRQLGNSLPGALALMANGLGITIPQLDKMVTSGQLLTSEVLGPLAQAMTTLGAKDKDVTSLKQSFVDLENAVTLTLQQFQNSAAYNVLNASIELLAKNFKTVVTVVESLGELWVAGKILAYLDGVSRLTTSMAQVATTTTAATTATVANTAAEVESTAATNANTAARKANATAGELQSLATSKNSQAMTELATSLGAVGPRQVAAAESASLLGTAMGGVASATRGALSLIGGLPGVLLLVLTNARALGEGIADLAAKFTGLQGKLSANEQKLKDMDAATTAAYEKAQILGPSIVKLTVAYNDLVSPLSKAIVASEKHAEAQKLEGEVMTTIANISGDLTTKIDTATKVTQLNAAAAQNVADKLNLQASATAELISKINEQVAAGLKLNDGEKKKLQTLQDTLSVQQASAEKAQAQADADNLLAAAAKTASEAARDQSANLGTLEKTLQDATDKVNTLAMAQKLGADVSKQLTAAQLAQAEAQALVNKAVQDVITDTNRAAQAVANQSAVTEAAAKTQQLYYQNEKAAALAIGDTRAARQADISSLYAQIDAINAAVKAKNADVSAQRQQVAALESKLNPQSVDYQAQLAAIAALKAKIQVEIEEARALGQQTSGLENQITQLEANTAATQQNTSAKDANATAANDAYHANHPTAVDNTGFQDIQNKLDAGTLSSSDLNEAKTALNAAKQDLATSVQAQKDNPGLIDPKNISSLQAIILGLQQAIQKIDSGPTTGTASTAATKGSTDGATGSTTGSSAASTSTNHTVTIDIKGGTKATINTASASDSAALVALLNSLQTAATTANTGG